MPIPETQNGGRISPAAGSCWGSPFREAVTPPSSELLPSGIPAPAGRDEIIAALMKRCKLRYVILTLGAAGRMLFDGGDPFFPVCGRRIFLLAADNCDQKPDADRFTEQGED